MKITIDLDLNEEDLHAAMNDSRTHPGGLSGWIEEAIITRLEVLKFTLDGSSLTVGTHNGTHIATPADVPS